MSKKEYRRTVKKLKKRREQVPSPVIVKRKRKNRDKLPLEGAREPLPVGWKPKRKKRGEQTEYQVQSVPETKEIVGGIEITNGVRVNPALVAAIKSEKDVKIAKKVAKIAGSWFRRLYAFEELELVKQFKVGDEAWWLKHKIAESGVIVRLKARKLVIKAGERGENVVMPVRKVKRGPLPKEYLYPDPKRWAIGRKAA